MICACPKPASITTIDVLDCFENIGQIKKLIFQRGGFQFDATPGTPNPFEEAASWTPLLSAATVDDTRAVVTPIVSNFIIPPTTAITETVDNEIKVIDGSEARATGQMRKWPNDIVQQVRSTLNCEPDLVFYAINKDNQLIGREIAEAPQIVEGIPIKVESGFVGDTGGDSKSAVANGPIEFSLEYGWRDNLLIKDPEAGFFPLTDLVPGP